MDSTTSRANVRAGSTAALASTAGLMAAFLIVGHPLGRADGAALFACSCIAFAFLFGLEVRYRSLPCARIVAVAGGLMVLAVAVHPIFSRDLWSYADYGRMTAIHHVSPYTHDPAVFPGDPAFVRTNHVFAHTRSVYGPVFTAISAAGMFVWRSPAAMRMFFQGLAALCCFGVVLLVARRTRDPAVVALVGLHPVVVLSVVNGGHADALIAIAVAAGIVLAMSERTAGAALVFTFAGLVKIVGFLALAGLVVWLVRERRVRPAATATAIGVATAAVAYLLAGGGDALAPLRHASGMVSSPSVWSVARSAASARAATVVVVVLALWLSVRARTISVAIGSALGAYLLLGAYILPWYIVWGLAAAAFIPSPGVQAMAATLGILFQLVYVQQPQGGPAYVMHSTMRAVLYATELAGVILVLRSARARRELDGSAAGAG